MSQSEIRTKVSQTLNAYEKSHPTTAWFKNPLSVNIMEKKYLHPGEKNVEDFITRVASIFNDDIQSKVIDLLVSGSFFPGGRTLFAAGSKGKFNATTSNCYICKSVEDSLDDIYESNKEIAKIFKSGGGIGINLSNLRPKGAKTNNAARTSTGAVSFMHVYNTTGSIIGFHGRRGATLIGLRISHPDIEEFINLRSTADMKAMNISCIIDNKFMEAVENDEEYELWFDVEATGEKIRRKINAKKLFHRFCEMNWDYGDPGVLFKDRVDNHNLMSAHKDFHIAISNPCAEYTGPAYNSCNLGSMNLYNYVEDKFTDDAHFNYTKFKEDVDIAVRALDQILDYGYDLQPLDQNREIITKWRAIGLGFFGFADALVALKIKYGSKESIDFADRVTMCLTSSSIDTSSILAQESGSFANFDLKALLKSSLFEKIHPAKVGKNYKLRNSQLISIAPTGSLSLLAGSLSSGIEPIFKCQYDRSTHGLEDQNISFTVADRAVMDLLEFNNIKPGSISTEEIKAKFPWIVEAADIDPIDRVKVQAAMQDNIDNAISSTVNLPESATVEDVENIYMAAWKMGLKGITVFRDNCKRASILNFKKDTKKEEEKEVQMNSIEPASRKGKGPLSGRTYRKRTACVRALYITVNRDENGNIFEIFTNKSVHGCSANIATITRMASLALRSGIKVENIIQELKENSCQACQSLIQRGEKDVSLSCPYAIGEALEEEYKNTNHNDIEKVVDKLKDGVKELKQAIKQKKGTLKENKDSVVSDGLTCPDCGERTLIIEGKCTSCKRCGYSKCD